MINQTLSSTANNNKADSHNAVILYCNPLFFVEKLLPSPYSIFLSIQYRHIANLAHRDHRKARLLQMQCMSKTTMFKKAGWS